MEIVFREETTKMQRRCGESQEKLCCHISNLFIPYGHYSPSCQYGFIKVPIRGCSIYYILILLLVRSSQTL